MAIIGFTAILSKTVFLPPTESPIMRHLDGIEYLVVVVYSQIFLLVEIIGIFVTVAGVIL